MKFKLTDDERDSLRQSVEQNQIKMKQSETITTHIGDGAATIFECSNDSKTTPLPRLTILMPFRLGYPDQKDEPAASLCLGADATKQLYCFLHRYFETVAEPSNNVLCNTPANKNS